MLIFCCQCDLGCKWLRWPFWMKYLCQIRLFSSPNSDIVLEKSSFCRFFPFFPRLDWLVTVASHPLSQSMHPPTWQPTTPTFSSCFTLGLYPFSLVRFIFASLFSHLMRSYFRLLYSLWELISFSRWEFLRRKITFNTHRTHVHTILIWFEMMCCSSLLYARHSYHHAIEWFLLFIYMWKGRDIVS